MKKRIIVTGGTEIDTSTKKGYKYVVKSHYRKTVGGPYYSFKPNKYFNSIITARLYAKLIQKEINRLLK
jgi:hypothetical protein